MNGWSSLGASRQHAHVIAFVISASTIAGCRDAPGAGAIQPVYDRKSGQLSQLVSDMNRDGRADTWSYMDGSRVVRIELDTNHDGTVDRWEYYDAAGRIEKIGASSARDATVDSWIYPNADGSVARIELSTRRDGRISRTEFYAGGRLDRAEEDTDNDGRADKWETYRGTILASVAYDTTRQGKPDRRLVYNPDGSLHHIEDGAGKHLPADEPSGATRPRSIPR